MPEQLTKHPDVTLKVLRSAGAKCGEGEPQDILRQCPAERFCKLPGGEVCIYGLPEAASMTQVSASDWQALQGLVQPPDTPAAVPVDGHSLLVGGAGVLVGILLGVAGMRLMRPSR